MKTLSKFVTFLTLAMAPMLAFAEPNDLPEPGSLALLGVGAVVGLAIWARDRKNKNKK